MRLDVVSRSGRLLAAPIRAEFDARGGIIGRAPDCRLVLPDPERHISRQQARIEQVGNDYVITCLSSPNAIFVAGGELRPGQAKRLAHGDAIVIGDYEMRVDLGAAASHGHSAVDPGHESSAPAMEFDPFAELDEAGEPPAATHPATETFPGFAHDARSGTAQAMPSPSDPLGLADVVGSASPSVVPPEESIDALIGGPGAVDSDPLREGAPPMSIPQMIPPTDFGRELSPFEPVPGGDPARAGQHGASRESRVSWHEPGGASPRGPWRSPEGGGDGTHELLSALLAGLGIDALPASPLAAGQAPCMLTPELMHRIGALLRIACDGTSELLRARATVKRELQVRRTEMGSTGNNPLKYSPNGEAALAYLLATKAVRGFTEPVPALREAYDDLLAHQIGFTAGMRAAIEGVVARFDPAVLESRLSDRSVLDALVPSARRARLWALFVELFSQISHEAHDDFERLFAREFARAYEEQIAQLGKRRL